MPLKERNFTFSAVTATATAHRHYFNDNDRERYQYDHWQKRRALHWYAPPDLLLYGIHPLPGFLLNNLLWGCAAHFIAMNSYLAFSVRFFSSSGKSGPTYKSNRLWQGWQLDMPMWVSKKPTVKSIIHRKGIAILSLLQYCQRTRFDIGCIVKPWDRCFLA